MVFPFTYFNELCHECGLFFRGNPVESVFVGLAEAALASLFMIGVAYVTSGTASNYQGIILLVMFVGIFDGLRRFFVGTKALIKSV